MSEHLWTQRCEHPDNTLVPDGEGWIYCVECRTCLAKDRLELLAPEMAEAILTLLEPCLECIEEDTGACGVGVWEECEHCKANAEADVRAWNELHRLADKLRQIGQDDV